MLQLHRDDDAYEWQCDSISEYQRQAVEEQPIDEPQGDAAE